MKRNLLLYNLLTLFFLNYACAQTQGINFQGVARNSSNTLLVNQKIGLRFTILTGSTSGTIEFSETRIVTTNNQALFAVVIGDNTSTTSTKNFDQIDWAKQPKFLKIELDPNAGSDYLLMGNTQLQSVPFSFYANGVSAQNISGILPVAAGGTGKSTLTDLKVSMSLDKVDNTPDSAKTVSKLTQAALDTKLATTDTSVMLSSRFKRDTASLSTRVDTKLAIADTSAMLSSRFKRDTANLSARIDMKAGSDSANFSKDLIVHGIRFGTGPGNDSTNVLIGKESFLKNISGNSNISIGYKSLLNATNQVNNIAIGSYSLNADSTKLGSNNIAIGNQTLRYNEGGDFNTAIGHTALYSNAFGSKNTALGYGADLSRADTAFTNSTAIGYGAKINASNMIRLGDDSIKSVLTKGVINASGLSLSANGKAVADSIEALMIKSDSANFSKTITIQGTKFIGKNRNVGIGNNALVNTSTGSGNVALGIFSMNKNIEGSSNVGIGESALGSNISGNRNIAIGQNSLRLNTESDNIAIGPSALEFNTTGTNNIGIGILSLSKNKTGLNNISIGTYSMNNNTAGNYNISLGYQALFSNTAGSNNTVIGRAALFLNTTGYDNVATGYNSLYSNSTGYSNSAFGVNALFKNTTGSNNIAIGVRTLYNSNTGSNNIALGYRTMYNNTTGNYNISFGDFSLELNTEGTYNTVLGHESGRDMTSGERNTIIGYQSGQGLISGNNNILIGNGATPSAAIISNEITLGNGAISTIRAATNVITSLSDARDKKNIQNLELGLAFIKSLKPRSFNWDKRDWYPNKISDGTKASKELTAGFIAQELDASQQQFAASYLNLVYKTSPDKWEATYGNLIPVLVKSIQELDAQKSTEIEELKKRIKELEQIVKKLLEIKDK